MNDSTGKSKKQNSATEDDFYLELPSAPDFVSLPPELPLWVNVKLCEEMLPVWNVRRMEQLLSLPLPKEEFYL
ncbi:MAG: hypothetical protein KDD55_10840 [Bdellovibrionales bacterium]|nr:hypothetical protein [Bdellovibrionales bacterium]